MFTIFPVIFIYSENIHLLPFQEIIIPLLIVVGTTILFWAISTLFSKNSIKSGLFASLFLLTFFSYGHILNLLSGVSINDVDLDRHRFLLIPFCGIILFSIIYLLKTKRKLNNLSKITNVVSVTIVFIVIFNIGVAISNEDYFFFDNDNTAEKFLGVGASNESFLNYFSENNKNNINYDKSDANPNHPDIYYIILDEYGSSFAVNKFLDFDNF